MQSNAKIIQFREQELLLVNNAGEPFVPMKPVVEGMGLAWQSQHRKLQSGRFATCITEMVIQLPNDNQRRTVTCLPLRKLTGWLMSIHPNKVRPELRDGIIAYQNECDDVLWSYWNEGMVVRHDDRDINTVLGQTIGTNGFNMLGAIIKGKVAPLDTGLRRSATAKLWSQLHTAFGVRAAEDIPADQLDNARNFIAAYAIEGEYLAAADQVNEQDQEQQKAKEFAQVMSRVACHRWHELDALTERHKKLLARSEQMMQQQQELLAEQHQIQQRIHAARSNLYDPIFEGGHYLFKFTGPLQSPDKVKQFVTMQNKARGLH